MPNVFVHPPHDHRQVQASKLLALKPYDHLMGPALLDYCRLHQRPEFEIYIQVERTTFAFMCLLLEHFPMSRIVPISELLGDGDPSNYEIRR